MTPISHTVKTTTTSPVTTPWIRRSLIAVVAAGSALSMGALARGPGDHEGLGGLDRVIGGAMLGAPDGTHGWHRGPVSEADHLKMRDRLVERATRKLSLDDAQKAHLVTLLDKLHAQRVALIGTQANSGASTAAPAAPQPPLQALLAGPKFDRAQAQRLVDQKSAAMKSSAPEVIAAMGDFFDGLKPEQQAQVREFLAQRGAPGERGERHHGFDGPRG